METPKRGENPFFSSFLYCVPNGGTSVWNAPPHTPCSLINGVLQSTPAGKGCASLRRRPSQKDPPPFTKSPPGSLSLFSFLPSPKPPDVIVSPNHPPLPPLPLKSSGEEDLVQRKKWWAAMLLREGGGETLFSPFPFLFFSSP